MRFLEMSAAIDRPQFASSIADMSSRRNSRFRKPVSKAVSYNSRRQGGAMTTLGTTTTYDGTEHG
ncbi:MAG: hypothetical protein N3A66_12210, partial [Planctomycetota bacterium]|nr:hypothetical protein [Planctomycetota bacterium]